MYTKFTTEVSSEEGKNGTGASNVAAMFVFRKTYLKQA